jgi:transcription elongation factor GreA
LVGDVLKTADTTIAESIWKSVSKNAGLDPGMQVELFKLIRLQFRELAEAVEEVVGAQEEASAEFLCTNESLTLKREDFRKLIEEDIPANSKDIEIAKGHGDLSENAEYQYAKERQQFLGRRVLELQQMIRMARPVDLRQVPTDAVCFGTRVALKETSSESEAAYTILGPWESKPEENIISYLSPLAAAMLGKKVDDRIHLQVSGETAEREYRIVRIEKTV